MNSLINKLSTIAFGSIIILLFIFSLLFACKKFEPIRTVKVKTDSVTNVSYTTCTAHGTILEKGEIGIDQHGFCFSTQQKPTIEDNNTQLGSINSTGNFSGSLTGLSTGTTYYMRAYAQNEDGVSYGEQLSFTTLTLRLPTLTTTTISNITENSVQSGGNITDDGGAAVTARGVSWSTSQNPTIANDTTLNGSGIGNFISLLSELTQNTTYYVRAYAINSVDTAYGNEVSFTTNQLLTLPTVSTTAISAIAENSGESGGNITDNGGAAVTASGVCWSTTTNPVATGSHTTDGATTGTFASSITGLIASTTYYVRAYATNSVGTAYGNEITFTTSDVTPVVPTLTTTAATSITQTTATSGGNITDNGGAAVTASGVCWSTTTNPVATGSHTTDGATTGTFASSITGLIASTTYYVRAYATNSVGTAYGNEITFTTSDVTPVVPTLTTTAATSITQTTATSGGNITDNGGAAVTASGVCWSTTTNPVATGSHTTDGATTGTFTSSITGLTASTTYYVRAYATNSVGTAYGNEVSFSTSQTIVSPTVTTNSASDIAETSATLGGNVTADGGATVTERGIYYSTSASPETTGTKLQIGSGTGTFSTSLTGLSTGTTYYIKAYAINSIGTSYGGEETFTTLTTPSLTTTAISGITENSAESGGDITNDGGASVTARGVCWSISQNPTITDDHTTDGSGTGNFISSLTGLTGNTTYYVRAYATNSVGTAYGNEVSFITSDDIPIITTTAVSSVTLNSAESGGNVTNDGGSAVTDRGVCWSTSLNPTTLDDFTTDGTGAGAFTSTITGLTPNTKYYVRAYATNSIGTAYGQQVVLKTYVGTVTDYDGNVYYTVTIGIQTWMAENLKTTHYANGDPITLVTDDAIWGNLSTGAYCFYDNDAATHADTYGALYNWYAVVDNRNVCPTGWHVPTNVEWTTLTDYLGGVYVAGGKMKETGTLHWKSPNIGATNESGFTGLPGGFRFLSSGYILRNGYFWSTDTSLPDALFRYLYHNDTNFRVNSLAKHSGFSVRCVKD